MPVGAWLANPDGNIYYMNKANMKLCGLEAGADLNNWRDRIHPEDRERVWKLLDKSRTERVSAEFRFKPSDEDPLDPDTADPGTTEHWVVASSGPARDETGEVFMIYGTVMDISTRKASELYQIRRAEAVEAKRQQEYFIDMTSHELRNPLSAIVMAIDLTSDNLEKIVAMCKGEVAVLAKGIEENAKVIRLCTAHMQNLVDDVLALSKLDSNLLVITPVPRRPHGIVEEVIQMYENEMEGKGIQCDFEVKQGYRECGFEWFELDPARVKQVLINLLTNAIKVSISRCFAWQCSWKRIMPYFPSSSRKRQPTVGSASAWTPRNTVQARGWETVVT